MNPHQIENGIKAILNFERVGIDIVDIELFFCKECPKEVKPPEIMAASALLFAFCYLSFGFWVAFAAFIVLLFLAELFPRQENRLED